MRNVIYLIIATVLCYSGCKDRQQVRAKQYANLFRKGESLYGKQNDSSFFYFNKYVSVSKDSLQAAVALNYMSAIQSDAGDYFGSQESLTSSLKLLDEQDPRDRQCLASDYNELGNTSAKLKQTINALGYFDKSIQFANDAQLKLSVYNNKARAYQDNKDYVKAEDIYKSILLKTPDTTLDYARVLTNLSMTRWYHDPHYPALPYLHKALLLRIAKKDLWGQNSSYGNLALYYMDSKSDSAWYYANKMYQTANLIHSPEDRLSALKRMMKSGPAVVIRRYFQTYQSLSDSLQTSRNAAKNQFALIRYNVEKSKADNLSLREENTKRNYQLLVLIIIVVSASIILGSWYRKRNRRMESEKQAQIHENRLHTSKIVHDTVANDIYRIMKKVQHDPTLDKDWLVDNINEVYERSRDISHEIIRPHGDYHKKITDLLSAFTDENHEIAVVGNTNNLWQKISTGVKLELIYILQELLVNMKKHSAAAHVTIKFQNDENQFVMTYYDDGKGLGNMAAPKNGLINMENRIKGLKGQLIFEPGEPQGLTVRVVFPLI